MDEARQQRLDAVAKIAVRLEAEFGLPPELLIAQWAVESEWGSKPAGHANYFGIKKAARHTMCCTVTTHEFVNGKTITVDLEFADYPSLEDSCHDYAWLITHGSPYAEAWRNYQARKDLMALVLGIARVYATDPSYWRLTQAIATQGNVAAAVANARKGVAA